MVLTEDWCGDAMLNVPILLRLSEKTNMEVRMLLRDENLDLMDQYLTNGKSRSIPIFIFIDQDGNEVAKWGPRSEYIQQFVDKLRAQLPHKDDEKYEEQFKETLSTTTKSFLERKDFWEDVHNSILEKLI
ncbi:thioredoxin family protein [Virgibacillus soli]|uniref:Thioredoxin family protein n=1 Tax=Paracerasibacillus soli TaxID=480284 RepID=A0ABU5CQW6_9BACI|nr:thioredoxin family protein [Virgibacillus soli]MDY0408765.1 thioredoxin family protein [Virgibacillus soli]